jgi:hypothetical protein
MDVGAAALATNGGKTTMSNENEIVCVFEPGFFAGALAPGEKLSKAAIAFEKSLPIELTRKQAEEIRLRILMLADPEERGAKCWPTTIVAPAAVNGWGTTSRPPTSHHADDRPPSTSISGVF